MKNVIDIVEYKQRKRKEKTVNFIKTYKVLLAFIVIFSSTITIWSVLSFKAAMLFMALAILIPLVFSKKSYLTEDERVPISKPQ